MLLSYYYLKSNIAEYYREIMGVLFDFIRMKSVLSPNKVRMEYLLNNNMYPSLYQGEHKRTVWRIGSL
jgi:hypothetical protein